MKIFTEKLNFIVEDQFGSRHIFTNGEDHGDIEVGGLNAKGKEQYNEKQKWKKEAEAIIRQSIERWTFIALVADYIQLKAFLSNSHSYAELKFRSDTKMRQAIIEATIEERLLNASTEEFDQYCESLKVKLKENSIIVNQEMWIKKLAEIAEKRKK